MPFELEQVNPYDPEYIDFWIKCEHIGRYLFVKDFLKAQQIAKYAMDIACGYGYGAEILSEVCNDVIAIDTNPDVIEYLENNYSQHPKIKIYQKDLDSSDITGFRFQHNPPNIIVSFETLEHLLSPQKIVEQFSKILQKNGYLFVSIPNDTFESIDKNGNPVSQFHHHSISKEEMEELLTINGFEIIQKLGQATMNKLMRWENRLFKKKRISEKWSDLPLLHDKNNIYSAAYIFGYPDENDIENSYSRIYLAKKK